MHCYCFLFSLQQSVLVSMQAAEESSELLAKEEEELHQTKLRLGMNSKPDKVKEIEVREFYNSCFGLTKWFSVFSTQ